MAYTGLSSRLQQLAFSWHTPHWQAQPRITRKGRGQGRTMRRDTRHDSKLQVSRIQMRLARHMSRSSSSACYCESLQNRGKCKEGEHEKESTVQDPLERYKL
ncbi:hypothetical protein K435DRAFT_181514 [Dendrothele bispora CBS 962.96]|uniref:Uncharacterized protein n=1 Tax=Dendrothele bispora (strain CBS 962.96) TaxID=1314807 RepID=A0A4S8LW64_DENBC|nr:hypothetical protein K435DRAFT_181514 [Dendrothele bispora CBS 962.96]